MSECNQCGSCCKRIEFWFVIPPGREFDVPVMAEFYGARGWNLEIVGDEMCISKPDRCSHLTEENRCNIHDTKPHVCRSWGEKIPSRDPDCALYQVPK